MPDIRELADKLWTGELDLQDAHPVHARFPEGQELLPGVLYYKGIASANTIDTGDGLVMLDTGSAQDTKPLFDVIATELLERRGDGLNPWLEQRFREFRLSDSKEDAEANLKVSPEADT